MSWDSRLVVISVLTFAVYGVANLLGQVGQFIPPLVLDFILIPVISLVFLFFTKPEWGSVLIFLYACYAIGQAATDPSVHAILENGLHLDGLVDSLRSSKKTWRTVAKGGLVISLILFAAMSFIRLWENSVEHPVAKGVHGVMIFFILTMTVLAFLIDQPQLRNWAFIGIGVTAILLVVRSEEYKIPIAEKRFLLLLSLTFLLDLLQMLSLALIEFQYS